MNAANTKAVVVGFDGGIASRIAAQQAVRIADARGVPVHLVTAVRSELIGLVGEGSDEWFIETFTMARQMLQALGQELHPVHGFTTAVVRQRPGRALRAEADRVGASAVVIGAPSVTRRTKRALAPQLSRRVTCDVLVATTDEVRAVGAGTTAASQQPALARFLWSF